MKSRKQTHLSLKLSLYLDGRLAGSEREAIERMIASDPSIAEEFRQLSAMRELLAARDPLPANPFLAERVMNRIREYAADEDEVFAIPRRVIPMATSLAVILLSALAVFAWLQRDEIFNYVEQTGSHMQQAYEESILKGWIMPLFQRTDRDEVLHFAMFGTLPLDPQDGTILRVDESLDSGYRVELAQGPELARPRASIKELYEKIQPTPVQQKVFDSLFLYAQRQIESSVLMNQEKEIAIDPGISKYHKVILSGIASSLDPDQLERFEEYLTQQNTPYTFVSQVSHQGPASAYPTAPSAVIQHFRTVRMPEEFIILTRDSITQARLRLDMDSLRRLMKIVERRVPRLDVHVGELARRYAIEASSGTASSTSAEVRVEPGTESSGGGTVRIFIHAEAKIIREMEREMKSAMREIAVRRNEATEMQRRLSRAPRPPNPRIQQNIQVFVSPDSEIQVTVNIDSIVEQAMEPMEKMGVFIHPDSMNAEGMRPGVQFEWRQYVPEKELRTIDSLLRERSDDREEFEQQREEILRKYRGDRPSSSLPPVHAAPHARQTPPTEIEPKVPLSPTDSTPPPVLMVPPAPMPDTRQHLFPRSIPNAKPAPKDTVYDI